MAEETLIYAAAPTVAPVPRDGTAVRTLLIPLAVLAVVLSQVLPTPPGSTLPSWLLGIALGSFVLALNSRAWVLAPLLVAEMSSASYVLPQFGWSLRLVVVLGGIVLAAPTILREGLADPWLARLLKPAGILVAVATLIDFTTSSSSYTIQYLRYQVELVLVMILVAVVVRSARDAQALAALAFGIGLVSAAAAIPQHYGVRLPFVPVDPEGRSVGLADSPVSLALQMLFVLAPLLGVLACGPWRRDRRRLLLVLAALLLTVGLYLSQTRSGLLGLTAGVLAIGVCLHGQRRRAVLAFVGMAVVMFFGLQTMGLINARYSLTASDNGSSAQHQALLDVGLQVVQNNPITGIGHANFQSVGADFAGGSGISTVSTTSGAALVDPPHNDFLYVWVSWGIVAFIAYVAMFALAIKNCLVAVRAADTRIRALAIGCVGGLVAYGVQSAFHNALDGSSVLWIYLGLSVALARLAIFASPANLALEQ